MRIPLRYYSAGRVVTYWLATIAAAFVLGIISGIATSTYAHAQSSLPYCDEMRTDNADVQVLCALRDQGILLPPGNTFTGPFTTSTSAPHCCEDGYDLVLLPPSMQPMCAKDIKEPSSGEPRHADDH
jgi:hypothetical protein